MNTALANLGDIGSVDVAIVGGGMVGLSMAQLLAKNSPDLRVCVLEKHTLPTRGGEIVMPSFDGRSSALSLGTVDVFQALNLWDVIAPFATAIREVQVSDRGHFGRVGHSQNRAPLGYIVPNDVLGQQLLAPGGFEIYAPANVFAIKMIGTGAQLSVELGGASAVPDAKAVEINAQLVIIADGAESPLRAALGIGVERHDYQQHALVANLEFECSHNGRAYERFTVDGPMAILPLGGSDSAKCAALVWTRPAAQIHQTLALSDREFIEQLHRCFGYRLGRIVKVGVRAHYPLQLMLASEQVRSSVALLGNAAHFLHPVAGQGFNLALRDAMQLAAVLAQAENESQSLGDLSVLQRYVALQQKDQAVTTAISHNFNRLFSNNRPWLQASRNAGLLCLDIFNAPKQVFFQHMMGRGQPQTHLEFMRGKTYG